MNTNNTILINPTSFKNIKDNDSLEKHIFTQAIIANEKKTPNQKSSKCFKAASIYTWSLYDFSCAYQVVRYSVVVNYKTDRKNKEGKYKEYQYLVSGYTPSMAEMKNLQENNKVNFIAQGGFARIFRTKVGFYTGKKMTTVYMSMIRVL